MRIVLVLLYVYGINGYTCSLANCRNSKSNSMLRIGDYIVEQGTRYPIQRIERGKVFQEEITYAKEVLVQETDKKRSCISEDCCAKEYVHIDCKHYHGFPDIINNQSTLKYEDKQGWDNTHSHGLSFECPGHNKVCVDWLIYYQGTGITSDKVYKFEDYEAISNNYTFKIYGAYNRIYGILWNSEILENYDTALPAVKKRYDNGKEEWIINGKVSPREQRFYMEEVPLYEGQEICKVDRLAICQEFEVVEFEHENCRNCIIKYHTDYKELPCRIEQEMIECDEYVSIQEKCQNIKYGGIMYCPGEEYKYDDLRSSSSYIEPYSHHKGNIIEINTPSGSGWKVIIIMGGIIVALFLAVAALGSCLVGLIILRLIF